MKRFLPFLFIALFCSVGCKSNTQKADALIKVFITNHLDDPKSYEPIETKLDTAYFHLLFDTLSFNATMKAWPIYKKILGYTKEMMDAEKEMEENESIFTLGKYSRAINRYNSYVGKKDKAWKEILPYLQTIRDRILQLDSAKVDPQKAVGWVANHSFRVKDEDGNSTKNELLFYIDPSFKRVISTFSKTDVDEFQSIIDLAVDNELMKDISRIH